MSESLHQMWTNNNKYWWISVNRFKSYTLIKVIIYIRSKNCAFLGQTIRKGIRYSETWQATEVFIILTIQTGVYLSYAVLRLPSNKCKFHEINTKKIKKIPNFPQNIQNVYDASLAASKIIIFSDYTHIFWTAFPKSMTNYIWKNCCR